MSSVRVPAFVMSEQRTPLKHLGFVENLGSFVAVSASTADKVYKQARTYTPAFVEPQVARTEDLISTYSAPLLAKGQDAGEKLLRTADDKVDYLYTTASSAITGGQQLVAKGLASANDMHSHNMAHFNAAKDAYFKSMEQFTEWLVHSLNPAKAYQNAVEAFKLSLAKAKELSDPDVAVQTAAESWAQLSQVPAVAKLLETAEPATKAGTKTFYYIHDRVVGSPLYKKALDLSWNTLVWASSTYPAKFSTKIVYPLVSPVVEPAYKKLSNSSYVQSTVDYWKPKIV